MQEKHLYSSTHSSDETDSLFGIALGIPKHTWPHPFEIIE